jgi:ribulose-phosphate 3-epimerase
VTAAGANTLVAGSAVFRGKSSADYAANIAAIRGAAEAGRVPKLQDVSGRPARLGETALIR